MSIRYTPVVFGLMMITALHAADYAKRPLDDAQTPSHSHDTRFAKMRRANSITSAGSPAPTPVPLSRASSGETWIRDLQFQPFSPSSLFTPQPAPAPDGEVTESDDAPEVIDVSAVASRQMTSPALNQLFQKMESLLGDDYYDRLAKTFMEDRRIEGPVDHKKIYRDMNKIILSMLDPRAKFIDERWRDAAKLLKLKDQDQGGNLLEPGHMLLCAYGNFLRQNDLGELSKSLSHADKLRALLRHQVQFAHAVCRYLEQNGLVTIQPTAC